MRTRRSRMFSVGMALALSVGAIGSANAADLVNHHPVDGLAEVVVSTCSWFIEPAVGDICMDTSVDTGYVANGPGDPASKATLTIFIEQWTGRYLGNEEFEELDYRWGYALASAGYVDKVHMLSAFTQGTVPMYDLSDPPASSGDPITVDLQWDLTGALRQTAGNQGPVEGFSWGRHGRDGCTVENWIAHQTWRWADDGISGTINGANVTDMFIRPNGVFIEGRSVFQIILNQTGVPC